VDPTISLATCTGKERRKRQVSGGSFAIRGPRGDKGIKAQEPSGGGLSVECSQNGEWEDW